MKLPPSMVAQYDQIAAHNNEGLDDLVSIVRTALNEGDEVLAAATVATALGNVHPDITLAIAVAAVLRLAKQGGPR